MSHLQISPEAPAIARAAVTAILVLHIGAGLTGITSGAATLAFRKGGRAHRLAGNVFFGAMLIMSGIGAIVSPMLDDPISASMGAFTFYLVATGWMTVIRGPGQVGRLEVGALLLGLGATASLLAVGRMGAMLPGGMIGGQPYAIGFVFGGLAAFAVALDARVILRGGLSGVARIARHLWRLCFGLFIAAGSFFLGQPQVFPAPLRGSPLLIILSLAPLGFMLFWLIRVRFRSFARSHATASFTTKPDASPATLETAS